MAKAMTQIGYARLDMQEVPGLNGRGVLCSSCRRSCSPVRLGHCALHFCFFFFFSTPFYLSPEICSEKPYDAKSDIWSATHRRDEGGDSRRLGLVRHNGHARCGNKPCATDHVRFSVRVCVCVFVWFLLAGRWAWFCTSSCASATRSAVRR
jgi:serine/threonine protein kinase